MLNPFHPLFTYSANPEKHLIAWLIWIRQLILSEGKYRCEALIQQSNKACK